MMIAADKNNVQIVKLLLPKQSGRVDDSGRTAMMHAINSDAMDVIQYL